MSKDEMLKDAGYPAPARDTPVPKLKHDCGNGEKVDTTTEKGEPRMWARVEFMVMETE